MYDLLMNPWVVSIGTGIIVGIIFLFLERPKRTISKNLFRAGKSALVQARNIFVGNVSSRQNNKSQDQRHTFIAEKDSRVIAQGDIVVGNVSGQPAELSAVSKGSRESILTKDKEQKTLPMVFISYSHRDEKEKDELLAHLRVLQDAGGIIKVWSDDQIKGGADWKREINEAMAQANVAILLISANFLTSRFILNKEVPRLLKRREDEGLAVFPVIAKACPWKSVDWLVKMNVRPKNGKPIWNNPDSQIDEELVVITEEIEAIVNE